MFKHHVVIHMYLMYKKKCVYVLGIYQSKSIINVLRVNKIKYIIIKQNNVKNVIKELIQMLIILNVSVMLIFKLILEFHDNANVHCINQFYKMVNV